MVPWSVYNRICYITLTPSSTQHRLHEFLEQLGLLPCCFSLRFAATPHMPITHPPLLGSASLISKALVDTHVKGGSSSSLHPVSQLAFCCCDRTPETWGWVKKEKSHVWPYTSGAGHHHLLGFQWGLHGVSSPTSHGRESKRKNDG